MTQVQFIRRVLKPAVFIIALIPAALLVRDFLQGDLGANPIEEITHRTGTWALTFLMITLSVTPVRRLLGIGALVHLRRMLGLFAFFYVSLHFLTYIVLDQFFELPAIVDDIAKRPYITVGFASFLTLIPLALTSTNRMVKRLGGRRWQRLHRLIYVAAAGGVLHFLWQVKVEESRPIIYGLILVVLLGYRIWEQRVQARKARRAPRRGTPAPVGSS